MIEGGLAPSLLVDGIGKATAAAMVHVKLCDVHPCEFYGSREVSTNRESLLVHHR